MAVSRSGRRETSPNTGAIKVWDPLVRVLHLLLAALFAVAYVAGDVIEDLHVLSGYAVVAIVGLRALWGLFGTHHARFDDFVPTPGQLLAYLADLLMGRAKRYVGHNPAGGAMTVLLLGSLLATAASGVVMLLGGEKFEGLHEGLANVNLGLVLVHIVGVLLSSLLHRESLVAAMISGWKKS